MNIARQYAQWAHGVYTTSHKRRCNVMTFIQRRITPILRIDVHPEEKNRKKKLCQNISFFALNAIFSILRLINQNMRTQGPIDTKLQGYC